MSADLDVFDLLGVSVREDSYNDFFKNLLEHFNLLIGNKIPLHDFLTGLLPPENEEKIKAGTWEIKLRSTLQAENESEKLGEGKAIPDLLLLNKITQTVIVIENKVLSKEGNRQTARYAAFVAAKYSEQSNHFYFFLTPSGLAPRSDLNSSGFKVVNYSKWAKLIQVIIEKYYKASDHLIIKVAEQFLKRVEMLETDTKNLSSYTLADVGRWLTNLKSKIKDEGSLSWLSVLLEKYSEEQRPYIPSSYTIEFGQGMLGDTFIYITPDAWQHETYCLRFFLKLSPTSKRHRAIMLNLITNDMRGLANAGDCFKEVNKKLRQDAIEILATMPDAIKGQLNIESQYSESAIHSNGKTKKPHGKWVVAEVKDTAHLLSEKIGHLFNPDLKNNPLSPLFELVDKLENENFKTRLFDGKK